MAVVERRITAMELEGGYLLLSQREADLLTFPEFSSHVELTFAGEPASLAWDSRARRVTGELITDAVALEASIGSLLRWTRDGSSLVLEVAAAGSSPLPPRADTGFARPSWQAPAADRARAPRAAKPTRKKSSPTRTRNRVSADFEWVGGVGVSLESHRALHKALEMGGWDDPESFLLRLRGERLACLGGFDELLGIAASAVDPMDHQIAAVSKALSVMKGRAILADEVGLGKTIEAGLILKELELRGLASRVLIVTPATLRDQWKAELAEKFGLDATVITSSHQKLEGQRLVMSLQLARNLRSELMHRQWDMVILDEAHRAAGPGAKATRELLEGLDSRYRLFLTATPVNNDLLELYRLVSLLRPGTFASQAEFTRKFVKDGDSRSPRNAEDLRQLVSNVMIRTTREQAGLDKVRRHAVDVPVHLSPAELTSYELVVRLLREVLTSPTDRMRRESLTRSLTLSPRGLYESARQASAQHQDPRTREVLSTLADIAGDSGPSSRQRKALEIVHRWLQDADKGRVIIFTQHTRVLSDLMRVLTSEGIPSVPYHGGMAASAKRTSLDAFRSDVRVLVSTDAGAEGLNLQHANAVINYDLPWNPMRIEQRIGRVHRVTQTRDVHIANLYSEKTIDEHVYRILVDKLRMFEILFGQVTTILGELEDSGRGEVGGFEGQVKHALYATSDVEMERRLQALARSTGEARQRAEEQFNNQGGISSWLAPLKEHRSSLKRDKGSLRPKAVAKVGKRADDAKKYASDWLLSRGATVEHKAKDFLSVRLPEDLHAKFGSDRVHLAFSPDSLHLHPDAELCVLGSPFFDELIAASAEYGDLLGWTLDQARIDVLPATLADEHPEGWELKERRVTHAAITGGRTHWLIADEDTRVQPEIREVAWGECTPDPSAHVAYRKVQLGDEVRPIPLKLGPAKSFTTSVLRGSVPELEGNRSAWEADLVASHNEDKERRSAFYRAQLTSWQPAPDRAQAQKLIERIEAERPPRVRVRCDLLALELVSATRVEVEEVWKAPDGTAVSVQGTYDARTGQLSLRDQRGLGISTLAFCDQRHAMSADEVGTCSGCGERACPSCPEAAWVTHHCDVCSGRFCSLCQDPGFRCALCGRAACSSCSDSGLCSTCLLVGEATEDDIARLPRELALRGLHVLVGRDDSITTVAVAGAQRRELIVLDNASSSIVRWVNLADTDVELLGVATRFAAARGLPGDWVLSAEDQPAESPDVADGSLLLRTHRWTEEVVSVPASGITDRLPNTPLPRITTPADSERHVLDALAPACEGIGTPLLRSRVERAGAMWLDGDGLHAWQAVGPRTTEEVHPWVGDLSHRVADSPEHATTMHCRLPGWLSVDLKRDSTHISLWIVPESSLQRGPVSRDALRASFEGAAGPAEALQVTRWLQATCEPLGGPLSESLSLEDRAIDHPDPDAIRLIVDGESLELLEVSRQHHPRPDGGATSVLEGHGLLDLLLDEVAQPEGTATLDAIEYRWRSPVPVRDVWRDAAGRGIGVSGTWLPGESAVVLQGLDGQPIVTLGACSDQHPCDVSDIHRCESCTKQACPSCRPVQQVDRVCGVCVRPVCRVCLPSRQACRLCGRSACASCLSGNQLCPACLGTNAESVSSSDIPDWLFAEGLSITLSSDDQVEVLRVVGGHRREVVVSRRDGGSTAWWSLAPGDPGLLGEALAAARSLGLRGDIHPTATTATAAPVAPEPGSMEISRTNSVVRRWRSGDAWVKAEPSSLRTGPSPATPEDGLLGALLASTAPATGQATLCTLESVERTERVSLTAEGLVRQISTGDETDRHLGRWVTMERGIEVGKPMPPEVVARAVASLPSGPVVTLASLGASFRFLIIRNEGDATVWDLDQARDAAESLAFGRAATGSWVPRNRLEPVPGSIPWDRLHGLPEGFKRGAQAWLARPASSSGPGRPISTVGGSPVRGDARFTLNLPPAHSGLGIPMPVRQSLDSLAPRLDPGPADLMEVILRQEFAIPTASGLVTSTVGVVQRGPDQRLVAADGRTLANPVVCSSGHLGESETDQQCQYCGQIRCNQCEITCSGCSICGIPVCESCDHRGHRCDACDDLIRIGMFAKRKWTKRYPDFRAGFTGYDRVHDVTVLLLASSVRRELRVRGRDVHSKVGVNQNSELATLFQKWSRT